MKTKSLFLMALLFLSSCSLFSSPTATAKKFIASAEKGDVDTMTSLFSRKAIEKMGMGKVRSENQNFSDMVRKVIAGGAKPAMNQVDESITGEQARVTLVYQDKDTNNSLGMGFDLAKENGAWKIDKVGGREPEDASSSSPSPGASSKEEPPSLVPAPPPPAATSPLSETAPAPGTHAPISAGVLNAKATSLPKPLYPPIARAAKASGTVVVQVLVDEDGNVVNARAVSGHPLLQAAAVAAARAAKFTPTKLAGKPVKVTGVVTYIFTPE